MLGVEVAVEVEGLAMPKPPVVVAEAPNAGAGVAPKADCAGAAFGAAPPKENPVDED